jgi:hypothetical protein
VNVDALAVVARARAYLGRQIFPQGMCLNFVWRMVGSINSIPSKQGTLSTALSAWNSSDFKHHADRNPPVGALCYFGSSPTRTDRNKHAGDVTIWDGSALICTDASGATVGRMSIAARERQTQRPYLGWTEDLGGHRLVFARNIPAAAVVEAIKAVPTSNGDTMIQVIIVGGPANGTVVDLAPGYMHHSGNTAEADITRNVISNPDERHNLSWDNFVRVCLGHGIERDFLADQSTFVKKLDDPKTWGGLWSEERAIHRRLTGIEASLKALVPAPTAPTK